MTTGRPVLTVHLVVEASVDGERDVLPAVRARLAADFGLREVTVQCERVSCRAGEGGGSRIA